MQEIKLQGTIYVHFRELLPLMEFRDVQNSFCVLGVLRSPILTALLHGTPAAAGSANFAAWYKEWNYVKHNFHHNVSYRQRSAEPRNGRGSNSLGDPSTPPAWGRGVPAPEGSSGSATAGGGRRGVRTNAPTKPQMSIGPRRTGALITDTAVYRFRFASHCRTVQA